MDIQSQFIYFIGFKIDKNLIILNLGDARRYFRYLDQSFQILHIGYGSREYDFDPVFRLVNAFGGQKAETIFCRNHDFFDLRMVNSGGIAVCCQLNLVIFRFPQDPVDTEFITSRIVGGGNIDRIIFTFAIAGYQHFLNFFFLYNVTKAYFSFYVHFVGLSSCNRYRFCMNCEVTFLHPE